MARNLEFKARASDPKAILTRARELGAELWGDLRQTDTYFAVRQGRLKLRETAGFQAELIYYDRTEEAAEKLSDYSSFAIRDGEALRAALSKALDVLGVVRKRRTLLLLDTTRIHLDNVEYLGDFVEIEVPVVEAEEQASERLRSLVEGLGFRREDDIRRSYIDLVRELNG
jgi:predicted adenylyl cyclase CyaB